MIVFKTFLKVLNKCKIPLILYTIILIFFAGFSLKSNEAMTSFEADKPDIYIINNDGDKKITNDFIKYMSKVSNIIKLDENNIEDALFYRDINLYLTIPQNFNNDFLQGKTPNIEIKSTGDYEASLAKLYIEKYLKVASTYKTFINNEEELVNLINKNLEINTSVILEKKIDSNSLKNATTYYNFLNYCLLAGSIFAITYTISSFKKETIDKRIIISKINYNKYLWLIFLSSSLFALFIWLVYVILSFILIGSIMFTSFGLIFIINALIFTICSLSIAFLLSQLILNKEALNGIVNVIALGSSFLCGSFVPMNFLPSFVLKIAHILPSYWYIYTNELISNLDTITLNSLTPLLKNMTILILFSVLFFCTSLYFASKKRKKA